MKILVLCDWFMPGYKGGGPITTISGMVDRLGDDMEFLVVTRDRDAGDTRPYPGMKANEWQPVGKAQVMYLSPDRLGFRGLRKVLRSTSCDVLYLNSFFSRPFTVRPLLLRWAGLIPRSPIVLAPRGEFSPGALAIKAKRKWLYLHAVKWLGIYGDLTWHASSEMERDLILLEMPVSLRKAQRIQVASNLRATQIPKAAQAKRPMKSAGNRIESNANRTEPHCIFVAPDLRVVSPPNAAGVVRPKKKAGSLNAVMLARISKVKNIVGAVDMLSGLMGDVFLDIYGPIEDKAYWSECLGRIAKLPNNVHVAYKGVRRPDEVMATLSRYHLFLSPTLGENYGHVIVEALAAGCPVLISDCTPWHDLEAKGVGWDLPLDQPERFRQALQACVDMDDEEFRRRSGRARSFADGILHDPVSLAQNRELFEGAVRKG